MTTDKEIDEVFERTNDLFWADKFTAVDAELDQMDVTKASTQMLVVWLSACYRVSDKLVAYKPFLERCTREFKQREPDRWKGLVGGFERPPPLPGY